MRRAHPVCYTAGDLQGGVKDPTGGKARKSVPRVDGPTR